MNREIKTTSDGSKTLFVETLDEHYHSFHGALTESMHVFIDAGLNHLKRKELSILEIGFGTGLNALLTLKESLKSKTKVNYVGVEAYPVSREELSVLDYTSSEDLSSFKDDFENMHDSPWDKYEKINDVFSLKKVHDKFKNIEYVNEFDLIYFDAFAPSAQPDLWTTEMFDKMYRALKTHGVLVTYCAKGQVKRNMKEVGFIVERLPGPPGKREMTRATKS